LPEQILPDEVSTTTFASMIQNLLRTVTENTPLMVFKAQFRKFV